MTSTLIPHNYINPTYKRRVLLKRSTQQINDPDVVQQLKNMSFTSTLAPKKKKKSVRFSDVNQVRYFFKSHTTQSVKNDPPFMETSADDYKLSLPNWPSKNTIFYNTEQKIRMENAQMVEGDIEHMENNQVLIEGRCRALNISFHKIVSVRYTFDLWRTYEETNAEFRESIASTSNTWDRFSFHIPITAGRKVQSLYIALKYTVDDQEFWDNNSGANYEITITPEQQVQEESEDEIEEPADVQEEEQELALEHNNTKVLGRRYDFTASLTAARKTWSPPPSPPGTPVDNENLTYTPPVFFSNDTFETYQVQSPQIKKSEPIPIVTSTAPIAPISAEGYQMSYSDFVNKYCFYNSHTNPIFSTSPSAVLS